MIFVASRISNHAKFRTLPRPDHRSQHSHQELSRARSQRRKALCGHILQSLTLMPGSSDAVAADGERHRPEGPERRGAHDNGQDAEQRVGGDIDKSDERVPVLAHEGEGKGEQHAEEQHLDHPALGEGAHHADRDVQQLIDGALVLGAAAKVWMDLVSREPTSAWTPEPGSQILAMIIPMIRATVVVTSK